MLSTPSQDTAARAMAAKAVGASMPFELEEPVAGVVMLWETVGRVAWWDWGAVAVMALLQRFYSANQLGQAQTCW
jgi:hypothetical protein